MRLFITILALSISAFLYAQDESEPLVNTFNINILPPGVGGEIKIAEKATIKLDAVLGFSFGFSSSNINGFRSSSTYFVVAPSFSSQFRGYFNRDKRIAKGKSNYNNSGLFAGLGFNYQTREIYNSDELFGRVGNTIAIGPIFGVQRTWKSNVQIGFSFGLGLGWNEFSGFRLGSPGSFNLAYVFGPKNK